MISYRADFGSFVAQAPDHAVLRHRHLGELGGVPVVAFRNERDLHVLPGLKARAQPIADDHRLFPNTGNLEASP
jgi:hypothetical protein